MIQALAMNKIKTIEIHGDKNIQFELFGKIIEQIRMAGAEDFIFATEKPKGP
jgi:biopolymer transport protein ExbD